jgi:arylsulfatase A-like enzyme
MSRSERGARGAAAVALACLALACGGAPAAPSLVVVTLDTLRRDHVGAYGDRRGLTPFLDGVAAQGLVHDSAWTSMPTTGPAHVSLFTGLAPSAHGSRANAQPMATELADASSPARLRAAGYATAAFVTVSLAGPRATGLRGFEIYDAPETRRSAVEAVRAALAWLEVERRRPVLLWVHLYEPHAPYGAPDEKGAGFVDARLHGWVEPGRYDARAARDAMASRYARGVRAADAALGELLTGVRAQLAEALIAIASDHGESLDEHLADRGWGYDHGEFLDPEGVRIALVLAGPGVVRGRSPGTVSISDLHATLLRSAGLPDGASARDLRVPSAAVRAVAIERRAFVAAPRAAVAAHAAAAAQGDDLVIVGADGALTSGARAPEALVAAARGALPSEGAAAPALDDATRARLRQLGYTE